MRDDLKELAETELAGILHADADNPEEMERAKQIARVVLDEHGKVIQLLPGPGELKKAGLGNYKKQMKAAFGGLLAKLWRKGRDRIFEESNSQAMLDCSHALKQDLGRDWKKFYKRLLCGESKEVKVPLSYHEPRPMNTIGGSFVETSSSLLGSAESFLDEFFKKDYYTDYVKGNQGVLAHLAAKGDIDESYVEKLARNTGRIFNKYPLQIYETKIEQATKQSFAKDGGLYRIVIEIRPGEFRTFFAKKHGKKDEYERTLHVQPLLAEITDKVSPVIAEDSYNDITVEKYIHGETLTQLFKRGMQKSDLRYIKDPAERAEQEQLEQEIHDREKKKYLIPALDELIEISDAVEQNRGKFNFLRALGKGGDSFTGWFKKKYKPNDSDLIALVQKNITGCMDEEDTVFCHGDAHTDNVIEQLHQPHWIDWEYAGFSIPQFDIAKLLKKTGLSEEAEEDVVRHVCEKRNYKDYDRFSTVYYKTKIFDALVSAAKYHKLSNSSRKHRAGMRAQADIYFTDALKLIEEDRTISTEEKQMLVKALEKDAKGRLSRLADEEYTKINAELDPYKRPSMENFGTPSIMEKYSPPPLSERLGKLWRKHKLKAAAAVAAGVAVAAGYFINDQIQKEQDRQTEKIVRTSQYYADTEKNEKLMPLVKEYASKYDNISEDELAAVINAAYKYNKNLIESWRGVSDWPIRDMVDKLSRQLFQLKNGLSEKQSFVKEEHLDDPENNVFAAAKRLSDMKKEFKNVEDVILAFFTSPEFVRSWKKKAKKYWDYSRQEKFEFDGSFQYGYKTLTDMALAYLKK